MTQPPITGDDTRHTSGHIVHFFQDTAVNVAHQDDGRCCGTKRATSVFLPVSCFSPGMGGMCPMREGGPSHYSFRWPTDPLVQERAGSLSENDGWSIMCGASCVIYSKVIICVLILLHWNTNTYFIQSLPLIFFYLYLFLNATVMPERWSIIEHKYVLRVSQDLFEQAVMSTYDRFFCSVHLIKFYCPWRQRVHLNHTHSSSLCGKLVEKYRFEREQRTLLHNSLLEQVRTVLHLRFVPQNYQLFLWYS